MKRISYLKCNQINACENSMMVDKTQQRLKLSYFGTEKKFPNARKRSCNKQNAPRTLAGLASSVIDVFVALKQIKVNQF